MAGIHDKMQDLHEEFDGGSLTLTEYYNRAGEMNLGFYKDKGFYLQAGMIANDITGENPRKNNAMAYILAYQDLRELMRLGRPR